MTPRISIRHDLTPDTSVYFTYSKGFKSAVLTGTDQSDDFAKPESLNSFEIGVKTAGPNYRLSASAFTYDYKDLQAQFWDGDSSILSNAEGAKISGVEVDGLVNVTDSLQVQGGFSWLAKAKYDEFSGVAYDLPMSQAGMVFHLVDATGDRMIKSPKFAGNLTLSYTADCNSDCSPSVSMFHSSEYWFDVLRRVKQGAYTTFNAQLLFKPAAMDSLTLSIFGRNLGNEKYFTSTLLGPSSHAPVYSPPRQFGVGISYVF